MRKLIAVATTTVAAFLPKNVTIASITASFLAITVATRAMAALLLVAAVAKTPLCQ